MIRRNEVKPDTLGHLARGCGHGSITASEDLLLELIIVNIIRTEEHRRSTSPTCVPRGSRELSVLNSRLVVGR
jgi:hypothetical protein